jgi:hypothetical protein
MRADGPPPVMALTEKAQTFIEGLGLVTKEARLHPKSTPEVPQVIVELCMPFLESFTLLEAYSESVGGKVSQYDWIGTPYNLGEARFSFRENRSLLLVSAAGKCACVVRNNDDPF